MFKLFFLGAGKMATAIAGGIVKAGVFQKSELAAFDVSAKAAQEFEEKTGVHCYSGDALNEGIAQAEAVLLAVKPQVLASALEPLAGALAGKPVISIVAGVPIARLTALTGSGRIVRVMPNTPALVGEGVSAVAFSEGYSSRFVLDIFKSIGDVIEIDEKHFAAVTSLSGSGPAYVYMFIDALIKGGVKGGLPEDVAKRLAVGTVRGSAKMVGVDPRKTCELVDAVCSKGGTTIRAVESFREDGLEDTVIRGMDKCRARAKELGDA